MIRDFRVPIPTLSLTLTRWPCYDSDYTIHQRYLWNYRTYTTNYLTTCTLHTNRYIFPILHSKNIYFGQLEILSVTVVFIRKQKYENNSVHCCRNVRKITIHTPTHYEGVWPNYKLTSVFVHSSSNSLNSFFKSLRQKQFWHFHPTLFFFCFWPISSSSQCCFLQLNPNLAHQHWEGKKTAKCPNNFDWDCTINFQSYIFDLRIIQRCDHWIFFDR